MSYAIDRRRIDFGARTLDGLLDLAWRASEIVIRVAGPCFWAALLVLYLEALAG